MRVLTTAYSNWITWSISLLILEPVGITSVAALIFFRNRGSWIGGILDKALRRAKDVAEAATLMKDKQIRRLPVLDRNRRLVGIVSLGDLAVQTGDDSLSGETLEKISEPPSTR